MNLNEIADEALHTAEQREKNGAAIKTDKERSKMERLGF